MATLIDNEKTLTGLCTGTGCPLTSQCKRYSLKGFAEFAEHFWYSSEYDPTTNTCVNQQYRKPRTKITEDDTSASI